MTCLFIERREDYPTVGSIRPWIFEQSCVAVYDPETFGRHVEL
jgi:hypothetical protein